MTNKKPFLKRVLHDIEVPLHQNLIYCLSHTAAWEQSLRAIWDAASWAAVLVLPQIKLNSQLSSSTFFLVNRLKAGGEGDDRGWDGWMALPTQWTWVSVNSGSWWWTGWPGRLQSMGSQRVRHDWATEVNWTESEFICSLSTLPMSIS